MIEKAKGSAAEGNGPTDGVKSFIEDLRTSSPDTHVLHGMVKPAEKADGLMFAHPGGCEQWVYIPAGAIQTVRRTGRAACGAYFHPTAEIELKAPQSELETALAGAANLHLASLTRLKASVAAAALDGHGCQPGTTWKCNEFGCGCMP